MATVFTDIPFRALNSPEHDELHEDLRQWTILAEAAINTLESGSVGGTLDASAIVSGLIDIARLPAGATITVDKVKNGAAWPGARPSARTDICVRWVGNTDPGGISINGDLWSQTP